MSRYRSIIHFISIAEIVLSLLYLLTGIMFLIPHFLENYLDFLAESIEYRMISRDVYTLAIVLCLNAAALLLTGIIGLLCLRQPDKLDAIRYMSLFEILMSVVDIIYSIIFNFSVSEIVWRGLTIIFNLLLYQAATRYKAQYLAPAEPAETADAEEGVAS